MKTPEIVHQFPQSYKELLALVSQGEGQCLEFKRKLPSATKTAKLLCALANTLGGLILVGITDNKRIHQVHLERELDILDHALNIVLPDPRVSWETFPVPEGKKILILKVDRVPNEVFHLQTPFRKYCAIRIFDETLTCPHDFEKFLKRSDSLELPTPKEQRLLQMIVENRGIALKKLAKRLNFGTKRVETDLQKLIEKGLVFKLRRGARTLYYPFRIRGLAK